MKKLSKSEKITNWILSNLLFLFRITVGIFGCLTVILIFCSIFGADRKILELYIQVFVLALIAATAAMSIFIVIVKIKKFTRDRMYHL